MGILNSAKTSGDKTLKKRLRKDRDKSRDWLRSLKEKLACEVCGETDPECLEFHHLDPSEKDFTLSQAAKRRYSIHRMIVEMDKCAVLCSNHHKKLHAGRFNLEDEINDEIHKNNKHAIRRHK